MCAAARAGHQCIEVTQTYGHESEVIFVLQQVHKIVGFRLAAKIQRKNAAESIIDAVHFGHQPMIRVLSEARINHGDAQGRASSQQNTEPV